MVIVEEEIRVLRSVQKNANTAGGYYLSVPEACAARPAVAGSRLWRRTECRGKLSRNLLKTLFPEQREGPLSGASVSLALLG